MAVYAIVPVKRIGVAKRRLSRFLNSQERKLLTVAMLEDVLKALRSSIVDEIVVVSNDSNVQGIAGKYCAKCFTASRRGLNSDIEEAIDWCIRKQADSVLILPADVPLVSPKDIDLIITLGKNHGVVLSPSNDSGTNALFENPPNLIRLCFGAGSFFKHFREACNKGVSVKFYYSARLAMDIDLVEDLYKLLTFENSTFTCKFLRKIIKK